MVQEWRAVIRVGFALPFGDNWLGGSNYFRNLLSAIYELPERNVEAVVFAGFQSSVDFSGFPTIKIVRNQIFDRGTLPWLIRTIWLRAFSNDPLLERLLKKHGIEVLSHSGFLGKRSSIPAIGWITDFQHVHLPENFNLKEIRRRNREFHNICRYCTTVIVSSYDAQSDLLNFDADCQFKTRVLQFVVSEARKELNIPRRSELERQYGFSGKYFLLPNQFWRHKNHGVIIEALGLLSSNGRKVLVLATGNATDQMHLAHFNSIMERAKALGVLDCFRHLGLIPTSDLAGLMRDATAIINPSYFEGWSTSVEEAKLMGKRILLSDIPVHREQNPDRGNFFLPDDAVELADLLWSIWNEQDSDEAKWAKAAQLESNKRRIKFAQKYQEIVQETLALSRGISLE